MMGDDGLDTVKEMMGGSVIDDNDNVAGKVSLLFLLFSWFSLLSFSLLLCVSGGDVVVVVDKSSMGDGDELRSNVLGDDSGDSGGESNNDNVDEEDEECEVVLVWQSRVSVSLSTSLSYDDNIVRLLFVVVVVLIMIRLSTSSSSCCSRCSTE